MSFVSYAQNYEDVALFRALGTIARGTYVDVGAGDPVVDSVTRAFYERGWRGINIEPTVAAHAKLVADRPEDVNLRVAVADRAGRATLHEVVGTGMSTLDPSIARQHADAGHQVRAVEVPVTTLDAILAEHEPSEIHFLKIDVEGAERQVLAGMNLARRRPWVILVEATRPNSPEPTHDEWESLLIDADYAFVHFDGLNRWYVPTERESGLRHALSMPPNYFDGFVRHSDRVVQEQANALAQQIESQERQLEAAARALAQVATGPKAGKTLAADLGPTLAWLTQQLDRREVLHAAHRAQAAHELHVREVEHANRVGDLATMISGLEARSAGLNAELEAVRAGEPARIEAALVGLRSAHEAAFAQAQASHAAVVAQLQAGHEAAAAALRAEIDGERAKAAALEASAAELQTEIQRHTSRLAELEAEIAEARAERDAARAELETARRDIAFAAQRVNELREAASDLAAQRAAADRGRAEVDRLAAELEAMRAAHGAERAEAVRLRERAVVAARQLDDVRRSWSWRVTGPARATATFVLHGVNRTLRLALAGVRATPGAVPIVIRLMSLFPALERRLRRFAVAYPPPLQRRQSRSGLPLPRSVPQRAPERTAAAASEANTPARADRIVYFYVDHTAQCPVNTGMQRVARGLARALLENGERVRFVKWDPEARELVLVDQSELAHLARWRGPVVAPSELAHYPEPGATSVAIGRSELNAAHWLVVPEVTHINFHGVAVTIDVIMAAKRAKLQTAFVFYDAIPLRRPEMAGIAPLHERYMQQLLLSDVVVPISAWSGRDLASFFEHHDRASTAAIPRIAPLLLPGESLFSPRATSDVPGSRRLVLAVGTVEPRKNQHALVRAFETFIARHPDSGWELLLVGNVHPAIAGEIEAACRRCPAIGVTSNLPDDELGALYDECAFTVFPSVEEGFGLPILESLWHGKPCICADFGAMAEVAAGGGCLRVDTRSLDVLAHAIERLALDPAERTRLTDEALARPLASWRDYGRGFAGLLDEESDTLRALGTVYYCIEHTVAFAHNTGIQRVVRGLARALLELGVRVVPVKWSNADGGRLAAVNDAELAHFAQWNGPAPDAWVRAAPPDSFEPPDWLLLPELTVYPGGPDLTLVHEFARRRRLRVASVFYDALPWKMTGLYAPHWGEQHARYMAALGRFERVLAISRHSRDDLLGFLRALPERTPDLEGRILACALPGEFRETPRSRAIRPAGAGPVRVLSVGSIEPRKNHLNLLRAFSDAVRRSESKLELVLAGGMHMPEPEATEFRRLLEETPGVSWEASADDARLRVLYAQCDFSVYPSLEEGFGLPILESLWNARPCICRDRSAMAEVADGGGCLMVDTADVTALADAILVLADDPAERMRLAREAVEREFRTWADYARDFTRALADERETMQPRSFEAIGVGEFRRAMLNLQPRPRLSVCITTYNRAAWLALSLQNIARILPEPDPAIEIVVCDNTSSDNTPEVVQPYLGRADLRYYRNPVNVGMLGNLQATAHHARGTHIWILGDDDLLVPGAIDRVLRIVTERPDLALVYLNYSYTREDDPSKVMDVDGFLAESVPIAAPGPDVYGPVREISTASENFFTAIYCLVFRRDHALRAYSQDTAGRPFSTMLTCIPTSYHVVHRMMDEPGCWVGEPQLVVNMNVSWIKYAPLWILERLPELFDAAELRGADPDGVDRWRAHNVPGIVHFFREIMENDEVGNAEYFSAARLVARFKHVEAFARHVPRLKQVYAAAHARGAAAAREPTEIAFAAFPDA